MDLAGFIDTYGDAIAKRVVESYPPLYRPSGSTVAIEVHHLRALRDLNVKGQGTKPKWVQLMAARKRKTLGLPDVSHGHPPRAEQSANSDINHWRAGCGERPHVRFGRGADGKVLR